MYKETYLSITVFGAGGVAVYTGSFRLFLMLSHEYVFADIRDRFEELRSAGLLYKEQA